MRFAVFSTSFYLIAVAVTSVGADAISIAATNSYNLKQATYGYWGPYENIYTGDQLGWGESYVLMGAIGMYEGTGVASHLQKVLDHGDRIIANRSDKLGILDQQRNRFMPAWTTDYYTPGTQYAWTVHAGMVTAPIARADYFVKRTPALNAVFGAQADAQIKSLIETTVGFESDWRESSGNSGYYIPQTGAGAAPYNQSNAMGRTFVNLYLATGQKRFRERAEKLANYFKTNLRLAGSNTRYDWSYSGQSGSEDISHAAINVDFAFACYRSGIVFTQADMQKFVATYLNLSRGASGATATVAGTGAIASAPGLAGMWGNLGYVDSAVRTEFYKYYSTYTSMGGGSWGMTVPGYLVATEQPLTLDTPLAQPNRQKTAAAMDTASDLFNAAVPGARSTGLAIGSSASRTTTTRQQGASAVRIVANDHSSVTGGWKYELAAGAPLTIDRAGNVGLWAKTANTGTGVSLLAGDTDGVEQSWFFSLPADNKWHFFQWSFDDAAQWNAYSGGNGVLSGLNVTIQSLLFSGGDSNAVILADNLMLNTSGAIALPTPGDADHNGIVDFSDLLVLAQHYDQPVAGWPEGDFDGDGMVDFTDLLMLAQNYSSASVTEATGSFATPEFKADWALAQSLLPEPTIGGAAIALFAAAKRRRLNREWPSKQTHSHRDAAFVHSALMGEEPSAK